jgi:S-adenosylmethionine:tRNA ribosyltransferase-isomerase
MSQQLSDYNYKLPRDLIASRPLKNRDESRLMVLHRQAGTIEHRSFNDLVGFIRDGDLLVLNDTRVLPARLFSDDKSIEFLLLERMDPHRWRCLAKPGKKTRTGATFAVGGTQGQIESVGENGEREFSLAEPVDLYALGSMPLPPYMERSSDADDVARYQTVFARHPGAVAAPTAGLHFTREVLARVPHTFVTLDVGPGTFRPVQSEDIAEHRMHEERFEISEAAATEINEANRVIAVGTTSVRVLESACDSDGTLRPANGSTDIFIYPPFQFQLTDALITNFHLPRSTLLMLVSAFAGRDFILEAYAEAIRERYRFYSYGDCMLIL